MLYIIIYIYAYICTYYYMHIYTHILKDNNEEALSARKVAVAQKSFCSGAAHHKPWPRWKLDWTTDERDYRCCCRGCRGGRGARGFFKIHFLSAMAMGRLVMLLREGRRR